MKHLTLITAILLIAFTVSAQSNRSRSERTTRTEPEKKEKVTRSRNSQERSNRSTPAQRTRPTRENNSKANSSSPSRTERSNREVAPPGRSNSGNNRQANPSPPARRYEDNKSGTRDVREPDRQTNRRPVYQNRESGTTRPRVEHNNPSRNARVKDAKRRNDGRDETYRPRTGREYESRRRTYTYRPERRVVRPAPKTHYSHRPIEYRRKHYIYRTPPRRSIIWTHNMYREYVYLYPEYNLWYYPMGYRIPTISAYDAGSYIGEVARVYGEVYDVWYSPGTREYYLYIGGPYPYQDFSIVLDRSDARRYSRSPQRFFAGRHIAATGLISIFEGKPEMFIKKRSQLRVY